MRPDGPDDQGKDAVFQNIAQRQFVRDKLVQLIDGDTRGLGNLQPGNAVQLMIQPVAVQQADGGGRIQDGPRPIRGQRRDGLHRRPRGIAVWRHHNGDIVLGHGVGQRLTRHDIESGQFDIRIL